MAQLGLEGDTVGVAIGVASEAVPVYIAEMVSPDKRGAMGTVFQLMITIGILCSASIDYLLAASKAWRWMFGLSVVPGILMAAGMCFMPESPVCTSQQSCRLLLLPAHLPDLAVPH